MFHFSLVFFGYSRYLIIANATPLCQMEDGFLGSVLGREPWRPRQSNRPISPRTVLIIKCQM